MRKASYNYIIRCDADDISVKNRFKDQVTFMKKNKKIDVLGSNIIEICDNKSFTVKKLPEKNDYLKSILY